MRHMLAGKNLALLAPRRVDHAGSWPHAFVTDALSDHVAISLKTMDYHCPLYLYGDPERRNKTRGGLGRYVSMMLLDPRTAYRGKKPNLNPALVADLDPPACRFEGEGDNRVERDRKSSLRYEAQPKRVYINAMQHFAPVPEDVWNYPIGGFAVCEKWKHFHN